MKICVYCGSGFGKDPAFKEAAIATGELLAARKIPLVYGGSSAGLMGVVADTVLAGGGEVIGVMPRYLVDQELQHKNLTELHIVKDMHERKMKMADLSAGFIALPGGPGTLEEMAEQWTWALLGIHDKPCAFLNINGFWNPLREMINHIVSQEFLHADYARMLFYDERPEALLDYFRTYQAPPPKWQRRRR